MRSEEKKNIIKNDYGIEMTKIVERSVGDMCSLGTGIFLEGVREGIRDGKREGIRENCLDNIKNIMKNLNYTEEQAMNILGLSEEEKSMYSKLLKGKMTI